MPRVATSKTKTSTSKSKGTASKSKTAPKKTLQSKSAPKKTAAAPKKAKLKPTKIKVKFDAGFPNEVYLRGKGASLNWDCGTKMKNIGQDEWIWETQRAFKDCEFKVLINDEVYESGHNHKIKQGSTITYTPHFPVG